MMMMMVVMGLHVVVVAVGRPAASVVVGVHLLQLLQRQDISCVEGEGVVAQVVWKLYLQGNVLALFGESRTVEAGDGGAVHMDFRTEPTLAYLVQAVALANLHTAAAAVYVVHEVTVAGSERPQSQVMNLTLNGLFHDLPLSLVLVAAAAEQEGLVVPAAGE